MDKQQQLQPQQCFGTDEAAAISWDGIIAQEKGLIEHPPLHVVFLRTRPEDGDLSQTGKPCSKRGKI